MEEAGRRKDSKKLFSIINKLAGKRAGKVIGMEPVKNLSGQVVSEKHDVLDGWKEHFENLNRDDPPDKERTIAEIQAVGDNINENSNMDINNPAGRDMEVTVDEISKAINQLRRDRSMQYCHRTFKRHGSEHKGVASQSNKYSVGTGENTARPEKGHNNPDP